MLMGVASVSPGAQALVGLFAIEKGFGFAASQ